MIDKQNVQEAKEKLGDRNFELIMAELGISDYDKKNMKCRCPFHAGDSNPSFVYDKRRYRMHCFGCQKNMDLIDAYEYNGATYAEACEKLFNEAGIQVAMATHGVKTAGTYYHYPTVPSKDNDRTKVEEYWQHRGISKETLDYCDIRSDEYGNSVEIVYNLDDVPCVVKYKPSHKINKAAGEPKCWFQKNADKQDLLFMMHKSNPSEPLIICEGLADLMTFIECGYKNVVSPINGAGSFGWIEFCWDFLEQWDNIIVASDNDPPGMKMRQEVSYRLGTWRVSYIDIPETIEWSNGKTYPINDINDMYLAFQGKDGTGKQCILEAIQNAKSTPITSVQDIADIQEISLEDMDGVETGLEAIDSQIYKMYYSTVVLLSGRPGAGKSSIINSIIANAIDHDVPCWLFSGELPGYLVRNWLNLQIAGPRHIIKCEDRRGRLYYNVKKDCKDKINEWLRGKLYLYKDGEDVTEDALIHSMEDCIRKFGVKVLCIDNLMCVTLKNNESELTAQGAFMKRLTKIAIKYNVVIILCAHPRKRSNFEPLDADVTLDDVAGSSQLGNLAHRSISLRRISKKEKEKGESDFAQYNVKVTINKDRLLGQNDIAAGLYYDVPTRRFFSSFEEYARQYSWDTEQYQTPIAVPDCLKQDDTSELFGTVG